MAIQNKVKKIIGWIGCAPVPMTRQEMEQALLINGDQKAAPLVKADERLVKLCGPIIEIVDDIPRFVHFTVSE